MISINTYGFSVYTRTQYILGLSVYTRTNVRVLNCFKNFRFLSVYTRTAHCAHPSIRDCILVKMKGKYTGQNVRPMGREWCQSTQLVELSRFGWFRWSESDFDQIRSFDRQGPHPFKASFSPKPFAQPHSHLVGPFSLIPPHVQRT